MSLNGNLFIDAVVVKGTGRTFTVSINHLQENSLTVFEPLDLNPYSIKFKIMGSSTADGKILIEKLITQNSNPDVEGLIFDPNNGQFSFTVTAEDTINLGLGDFPIMLELVDPDTLETQFVLTEGGQQAEFNKIKIVQV